LKADFFNSLESPVNFYIIRHGQSEGNAAKLFQGRSESPLSADGRLQAAARGRSLKTIPAGRGDASLTGSADIKGKTGRAEKAGNVLLFSSPLGRARETAEIISREASLPDPVYLDELMEMKLGIWSGKNFSQVRSADPVLWDKFMIQSWDAIPEAESSSDLYNRALLAWSVLRDAAVEQEADKVIVVTHGGLIQWLFKTTFQCHSWFPLFSLSNCGLSRLYAEPRGQSSYMSWEEVNSPVPSSSSLC